MAGAFNFALFLENVLLRRRCAFHSLPNKLHLGFVFKYILIEKDLIAINMRDAEVDLLRIGFIVKSETVNGN
jgi:hypothetical protein